MSFFSDIIEGRNLEGERGGNAPSLIILYLRIILVNDLMRGK
jgi:hypothetical protein